MMVCVHVELNVPVKWWIILICEGAFVMLVRKMGDADVDFCLLLIHWGILPCNVCFNCPYTTAVLSCLNDGKEATQIGQEFAVGVCDVPPLKGEMEEIWFCT